MTCPGCGHDNPETARFGGGCRARLEVVCGRQAVGKPVARVEDWAIQAALRPQ